MPSFWQFYSWLEESLLVCLGFSGKHDRSPCCHRKSPPPHHLVARVAFSARLRVSLSLCNSAHIQRKPAPVGQLHLSQHTAPTPARPKGAPPPPPPAGNRPKPPAQNYLAARQVSDSSSDLWTVLPVKMFVGEQCCSDWF